jgi:N-acetylglutamate synthase
MLLARGYRIKDRTMVMTAPLGAHNSTNEHVRIEGAPTPGWLDGVSALQEPSKSNAAHLQAIVGRIQLPVAYATVVEAGESVGFGMAAIDRGFAELGSIILAPAARGRGLGRALVQSLLGWASQAGAQQAFLQVTQENTTARRLYSSVGFADICGYTTMVRDGA